MYASKKRLNNTPSASPSKAQALQKKNKTGIPDGLKTGMESVTGHNLDHVRVHYNSSEPAAVQAHAYAKGNNVYLASGQEKHLPHELGHVVQQMEDRVQPTTEVNGVPVNDDKSLEDEADQLAAAVNSLSF